MPRKSKIASVRWFVDYIISVNAQIFEEHREPLIALIPENIINLKENSKGYDAGVIMRTLDEIRFKKTDELASLIGKYNWRNDKRQNRALARLISTDKTLLHKKKPEIAEKLREIRFLFNVASTIIHG